MEIDPDRVNAYLGKLHGDIHVAAVDVEAETLIMKFGGAVGGPYDDGELELTFDGVDLINLPLSLIAPVRIRRAEESETLKLLPANYRWSDRTLWILTDGVDTNWHVYAARYSVKVLPVFWQKP